MRFCLIDKITSLEPGKSLTAVKNLTLGEEYLADHFPGFPVMPGVLMIEALVQSGAWLMRQTENFAYSNVLMKQARAVKFNNFVAPGNTLEIKVDIQKWEGPLCTIQGTGLVNGGTAVNAKLTLERFNLADNNPELAELDAFEVRSLKELFAQLWKTKSHPV